MIIPNGLRLLMMAVWNTKLPIRTKVILEHKCLYPHVPAIFG
jgi:hypothetical protein